MGESSIIAAAPLLWMASATMVLLLCDLFRISRGPFPRLWWGAGICIVTAALYWPYFGQSDTAFEGMMFVDSFGMVFAMLLLGGAAFTFLFNDDQLEPQRVEPSIDIDVLILLATLGGLVMVSAAHMLTIFLGFELLSLSVYVLAGSARRERVSAEGALKYFILGAFSSAFLLYGMALVYGATGSMHLGEIAGQASSSSVLLMVGLGMIIFGFGFKVSLVPFHFWTPDVYHGAPVSITGFMAVVVKAAAFGTFFRVLYTAFGGIQEAWTGMIVVLSVLSMTVGNLVALRQRSLKRMLAYSSIAHAGYAMIGFLAFGAAGGGEAVIYYMLAYTLMTLGAFGVVLLATAGTDAQYEKDSIDSLQGLGWSHPLLGIAMTVAMLSLAGIPPLAGFMGKVFLFSSALRAGFVALAVFAALNSVVSLYYYLRVVVVMYFSGERKLEWEPPQADMLAPRIALVLVTLATIYVGLFSDGYYRAAQVAIASL